MDVLFFNPIINDLDSMKILSSWTFSCPLGNSACFVVGIEFSQTHTSSKLKVFGNIDHQFLVGNFNLWELRRKQYSRSKTKVNPTCLHGRTRKQDTIFFHGFTRRGKPQIFLFRLLGHQSLFKSKYFQFGSIGING
ncbi:hypothetical protein H5410_044540 [Solanum commersonii]|uniref:Uncharacterized protein n=1 Tax=Solanum commersonii TaxID=4109 RepID=A0A9J5X8D7_SOLCO|nr:hypothetical protein H5410_044540 [Solanum commersonii]